MNFTPNETLAQLLAFATAINEAADVDPDDTFLRVSANAKDGSGVKQLVRISYGDVLRDAERLTKLKLEWESSDE